MTGTDLPIGLASALLVLGPLVALAGVVWFTLHLNRG